MKEFYFKCNRFLYAGLLIFISATSFCANRFWIAGAGANWNNTANWSTTSGGGGGATVPGPADVAIFNASGAGNCNIDATVNVSGIQILGYVGAISQNGFAISIGTSGYTQTSGTFNGGSNSITITTGLYNLSGGTFLSTSGNFSIGGTWSSSQTIFTHNAGTFTHNSGTVIFNPFSNCFWGVFTIDVVPATSFYNLTINGNGSCGVYSSFATGGGDVVGAANDLTVSDGFITGSFSFANNLIVGSATDGGSGVISAVGTGAQTYAVAVAAPRICILEVNKSSGALTPALGTTDLTLQGFKQTAGNFTAPSGNMSIGGTFGSNQTIFNHIAGTFSHNNGTVIFDPFSNCFWGTYVIDVNATTLFYNITINGNGSCGVYATFNTAAGDVAAAANDFTHTDGFISGSFSFNNNLVIGSATDGGTGILTASGSGAQTYAVAASAPRSCVLTVNKASGALTPAVGTTDLTLQGLNIISGDFTAPSNNLSVGGTFSSNQTLFNHVGGTFAHNNGTVIFDPFSNCFWGTYAIDVLSGTLFYNININGNGSCGVYATFSTGAGDLVAAVNDFTHADGFISGSFSFMNNLIISTATDGGTGMITANGTGAQTYAVAASSPRSCFLVVNKSSGALTPAVGTTDLTVQGFSQLAGDFTAPSNNFSIGGTWSVNQTIFNHAAGTFSHNNGTVIFDPFSNCFWGTYVINVIPTTLFYNMNINGSGSCGVFATFNTAAGDVAAAANDFTHTDGYISGNFSFMNNLTIGTLTDGGTGTVTANGTGAQNYIVAASAPRSCVLAVNKASGALTPAVGTTDLTVQGFLQLAGDFTAPSNNFSIGGTWSNNTTLFNHTAGTFSHNNGSVIIDPFSNCFWGTYNIDVIPTTLFYNITINGSGSCGVFATIATGAGDIAAAANDFTHTDGFITGNFSFANNLNIGTATDGGTGTVTAVGTGAQLYNVAVAAPRTCVLAVNKSSGALTPGVGTTNMSVQGFRQILGDFTAPSGNFSIGGTWGVSTTIFNHQAGTFSHNNGTVILDPFSNCFWGTYVIDVIPTTLFYNLTINGNGSCGVFATMATGAGDVAAAANDLTHTDGYITGSFSFNNNLSIGVASDSGTGIITALGTGAQLYAVASAAPRTCILAVNKASGALTPAVGTTVLSVQGFRQLLGDFTAPSGNFSIGGTLGSSQTIFNHAGGTFSHNSGTVIFDPFSNCYNGGIYTIDVIPTTLFYNIILNGNGSCGVLATIATGAGDVAAAANDFTHTDSYISGSFSFINNMSIGAASDGGTGTITANGAGAQNYAVAAGAPRTCVLVVNKASGALTPAGGTSVLSVQGFYQLAGDFTAPSGNFSVGGTWSVSQTIFNHAAGTFSHNSGTVVFDPFSNCFNGGVYTIDVIPTTSFYNTTFSGGGSCGVIATIAGSASDTLETLNALIFNNGTTNTFLTSCQGNVTIQAGHDGGNSPLIMDGSNSVTIDASGAVTLFNGRIVVTKSNASKTITMSSALTLDAAAQTVTFVKGRIISTAANMLEIGDNVTVAGASDSSFVFGPVRKTGNDAFTFPLGATSPSATFNYAPIAIGAPGNVAHQFTAEYFQTDPHPTYNAGSLAGTLNHVGRAEYWILDRTVGASNVLVTLSWAARSSGVSVLADLRVARWNGASWVDHGNGGTTGNTTAGTVVSSAVVTAFSPFTLASSTGGGNNILPVELTYFTGNCISEANILFKWATASEKNNKLFTLQGSENGLTWKDLATIEGDGNSIVPKQYTYEYAGSGIDKMPFYYRLKQTDFDLSSKYYDMIYIGDCAGKITNMKVYPNPILNEVYIQTENINTDFRLYNAMGQEQNIAGSLINSNTLSLNLEGLDNGVYYLECKLNDGKIITTKIIK